ncbi:MAG TPA: hypothetical protein VNI01_10095 [Elusimicrobiota bacterium]|nr:hypothetical protein [Elusimicrobiota bacterium]
MAKAEEQQLTRMRFRAFDEFWKERKMLPREAQCQTIEVAAEINRIRQFAWSIDWEELRVGCVTALATINSLMSALSAPKRTSLGIPDIGSQTGAKKRGLPAPPA